MESIGVYGGHAYRSPDRFRIRTLSLLSVRFFEMNQYGYFFIGKIEHNLECIEKKLQNIIIEIVIVNIIIIWNGHFFIIYFYFLVTS